MNLLNLVCRVVTSGPDAHLGHAVLLKILDQALERRDESYSRQRAFLAKSRAWLKRPASPPPRPMCCSLCPYEPNEEEQLAIRAKPYREGKWGRCPYCRTVNIMLQPVAPAAP